MLHKFSHIFISRPMKNNHPAPLPKTMKLRSSLIKPSLNPPNCPNRLGVRGETQPSVSVGVRPSAGAAVDESINGARFLTHLFVNFVSLLNLFRPPDSGSAFGLTCAWIQLHIPQ